MATIKQFCDAMEEVYINHGMYVGTGNGELVLSVANKFFEMEKNYGRRNSAGEPLWYTDTARDYEYLAKCYRNHWDMTKARAGDCSGHPTGCLRRLGVIPATADYNCRTFQENCTEVELTKVQPGDLVFDKKMTGTKSTAGHMGVVTAIENGYPMVVESKGRDDGVVRRKLSEGGWKAAGRLYWFEDSIPPLTRELKYVENNLMHGEDVKQCQKQLSSKGFNPGSIDGYFGKKTESAVIDFQKTSNLNIKRLGVVGQKTWTALFK